MRAAVLALALAAAGSARAGLTSAQLEAVAVRPPQGAAIPLDLPLRDEAGRRTTPGIAAHDRPVVWVFTDYACATLCGPALAITGERLAQSGLASGRDYHLIAIGLQPDSAPSAAKAFLDARLPAAIRSGAVALTGDAAAVRQATAALGYGYRWDAAARAYAHPVAAFVLTPDGRLSRTLSEVALTAPELRAAVTSAAEGRTGDLLQSVALVCHRALEAVGRFDAPVLAGLRAAGLATLAALTAAVVLLLRRRRRA